MLPYYIICPCILLYYIILYYIIIRFLHGSVKLTIHTIYILLLTIVFV